MAKNPWDAWLQGLGHAPAQAVYNQPTTGYTPLTGTSAPRTPMNYRPNVLQNNGRDAGSGTDPLNKIGTTVSGAWYSDIPQTSFSDFISPENGDWNRREWAGKHGLGEQTEDALGRFTPNTEYWLAALGQDKKFGPGVNNAPQAQADLEGQLYGRLLGPQSGYIDPKAIMSKVVGSTWNGVKPGQNDYIANLVANPALDPDSQVSNFWSFVNGTVGRLMPSNTMQSYQNLIQREGNLYKDFMAKNPAVSMTFNKWVQQRLGPTGGL